MSLVAGVLISGITCSIPIVMHTIETYYRLFTDIMQSTIWNAALDSLQGCHT